MGKYSSTRNDLLISIKGNSSSEYPLSLILLAVSELDGKQK